LVIAIVLRKDIARGIAAASSCEKRAEKAKKNPEEAAEGHQKASATNDQAESAEFPSFSFFVFTRHRTGDQDAAVAEHRVYL